MVLCHTQNLLRRLFWAFFWAFEKLSSYLLRIFHSFYRLLCMGCVLRWWAKKRGTLKNASFYQFLLCFLCRLIWPSVLISRSLGACIPNLQVVCCHLFPFKKVKAFWTRCRTQKRFLFFFAHTAYICSGFLNMRWILGLNYFAERLT